MNKTPLTLGLLFAGLASLNVEAAFVPGSTTVTGGSGGAGTNPTPGVEYQIYKLNAGRCKTRLITPPDPAYNNGSPAQDAIFQGDASTCVMGANMGAGSNMELGVHNPATLPTTSVTLTGTLPVSGKSLSLSSLTLADWNTVTGPGITLAHQYIMDAITAHCGVTDFNTITPSLTQLVNLFVNGNAASPPPFNQFNAARISDPNIAFVNEDAANKVTIGLAGSDFTGTTLTCPASSANAGSTPTVQTSEVVKVNGIDAASGARFTSFLYSFTPTPSGVTNKVIAQSHTQTYVLKPVFDPPTGKKTGVVNGFPVLSWTLEWINPNPTPVSISVADPIPADQSYVAGTLTCTGALAAPAPVCSITGNQVTFKGVIPANSSVFIKFDVNGTALPATNTAIACADGNDPTGKNLGTLDPNNCATPTVPLSSPGKISLPTPPLLPDPKPIPTLATWALLLLSGLMAILGFQRRRS